MSEVNVDGQKKISRRDFLKTIGAAITILGLEAAGAAAVNFFLNNSGDKNKKPEVTSPPPPTSPTANKDQFPPDLVFTGEARPFEGEAAKIVEGLKKDFGVKIISPMTWENDGQVSENLAWNVQEIAPLAESISQLPPEYRNSSRSPREVLLLKTPGSKSEGAGGGYASRRLVVYISEAFASNEMLHGQALELYGQQRDQLRASVHHEYTHSFIEAHPDVLSEWGQKTGWRQDKPGAWSNDRPQNLIPDSGADKSPNEDIAVSAGIMLVNPTAISEDRRNFFLTNEHYANWPIVLSYKSDH